MMLLFTNNAFVPCTVLTCDVTVHALEEKKNKEKQKKKKKKEKDSIHKRGFGNADPTRT